MRTVALIGEKGGSGKSLLACHLAVGLPGRVALVDLDEQGSASAWGEARVTETPVVIAAPEASQPAVFAELPGTFDYVVVDTQGHASARAAAILRAVDFAVCPIQPTALDVATGEQTASLVTASGTPGMFVLTVAPIARPRSRRRAPFLGRYCPSARSKFPTDGGIYGRAIAEGASAQEWDQDGAPAERIAKLCAAIEEQVNNAPV
jgi:chromosome partitioning protein